MHAQVCTLADLDAIVTDKESPLTTAARTAGVEVYVVTELSSKQSNEETPSTAAPLTLTEVRPQYRIHTSS